MVGLWRYASEPGASAEPPARWPEDSAIPRQAGLATIVMLAHPQCPCTRASVAELAVLMTRLGGRARAHVLVMRPRDVDDGWEQTSIWREAAAIPGVSVRADVGSVEAHRFHASTSGVAVVYDAAGRLVFHGGITGARGHQGDNPGLDRVASLLTTGAADRSESPVFGCALEGRASAKEEER